MYFYVLHERIFNLYCIFYYLLVPLNLPPLSNHHTVFHVYESFSILLNPSTPNLPPTAVILLSICEPVSILLISSVCLLDSTYE